MNQRQVPRHPQTASRFTEKQGQYLAFIHAYTVINQRPPAQADMQRHFHVTPPTVHRMVFARSIPIIMISVMGLFLL